MSTTEQTTVTPLDEFKARVSEDRLTFEQRYAWHVLIHEGLGLELPWNGDDAWISCTQYVKDENGRTLYEENAQGSKSAVIDVEATKDYLRKIARFALDKGYNVEKSYAETTFELKITLAGEGWNANKVRYTADRKTICKPVVVGKKNIPAKPAEPPKVVDVIEWECDERFSLLK